MRRAAAAAGLALAVAFTFGLSFAACAGGRADSPSAPASSAGSATPTIEVTLTDALRIEPAAITVRSGELVRFIVTNTGATEHEFYLGDEAAQQAHESEMAAMGGMLHDEPAGIALKPRETKELIFAFTQIGVFYAGCHVNGHYAGGMRAAVTVSR